ncbi:hypothetical protein BCR42DRAFT_330642 [Absidia repens]|uniref:Thioredoxin domain-containing protein n=1 Tax=Absidia repens TaxID=90262 RepID=A0A1X2ID80_9FUNG|nr:hypothetical protein BCR42DRAFT_330642 [Absidia repens]
MTGLGVWKCVMSSTAEELASVLILYTKVYTVWNFYWTAGMWNVFLYSIGWVILSTLCPQPWYQGPTKLVELTETAFRQRVCANKKPSSSPSSRPTSPSTSTTTATATTIPASDINGPRITGIDDDEGDKKIKYWVVMLYANWSVACLNFEAVLAKLSLQYDVSHIRFGKIDIGIYSDLAQEYGVSIDPASLSLPTLVLFKYGVELRRLPELTVQEDKLNTSAVKDTITQLGWSKKPATVINTFQLDKIAAENS